MAENLSTLCLESGEYVGPFLALERLPEAERVSITTEHPIVIEAGRVCLGCPSNAACNEDADLYAMGKGMKHWHSPQISDLPVVRGARLLSRDDFKNRITFQIEVPGSDPVSEPVTQETARHFGSVAVIEVTTREDQVDIFDEGEPDISPVELSDEVVADLHAFAVKEGVVDEEPEVVPGEEEIYIPPADVKPKAPAMPAEPAKARKVSGGGRNYNLRSSASDVDPSEDLVRMYLADIGKHNLLTKDDEVRLAKEIEAGIEAANVLGSSSGLSADRKRELKRIVRNGEIANLHFVQCNLRLVVSIAKKYQASGLPLLDLIQEGNLGLMHAVEKFDWRKGFKFSTYSTWWIRQAITRGIANTGRAIRLPVHAGDTLNRVQKARTRLEQKHNRAATLVEIAAELEVPVDSIVEILRYALEPLSLSEPLRHDSEAELGDLVADRATAGVEEQVESSFLPGVVADLLKSLDARERTILTLRFGLEDGQPRTLEEVGEYFNLTRERIRQIEARAMSKLRHPVTGASVIDFLQN